VEDLEALRTSLDHERIDILAHSWGGLLGVAYAIEHPERVGRLILLIVFTERIEILRSSSESLSPT
jgi:alpha-beta hydrolase superfamily lysophospholipase